ncbi:nicotinate-nucleotide--dimethylbenzimidazole phosphoribosyltransferase [Streptomyces sp. NPDC096012]|uniref:nicotinate-nucleotide--dimethylbenzimidazole phosphoribosyltransferase n=1 Tax=Streptomyces sp. NPDC096012 TaxID=3155684 RepID=UPI00336A02BC
MTDTGQVPGEGQPESAGMVEQPGAAYTYLSEAPAGDEDLLLPGAQGAWGNEVPPPAPEPVVEAVHEPGPHETSGRDSGSVDLSGVRLPASAPASVPPSPILSAPHDPAAAPQPARRPLHLGPPIPDASASPVRSLADRGPAGAPVRQPGPAASGPEYLDGQPLRDMGPQTASPWGAAPGAPADAGAGTDAVAATEVGPEADAQAPAAETVDPLAGPAADTSADPSGAAQATLARLATQAVAQPPAPAQVVHGHDGVQPAHGHDGVDTVAVAQAADEAQQAAAAQVGQAAMAAAGRVAVAGDLAADGGPAVETSPMTGAPAAQPADGTPPEPEDGAPGRPADAPTAFQETEAGTAQPGSVQQPEEAGPESVQGEAEGSLQGGATAGSGQGGVDLPSVQDGAEPASVQGAVHPGSVQDAGHGVPADAAAAGMPLGGPVADGAETAETALLRQAAPEGGPAQAAAEAPAGAFEVAGPEQGPEQGVSLPEGADAESPAGAPVPVVAGGASTDAVEADATGTTGEAAGAAPAQAEAVASGQGTAGAEAAASARPASEADTAFAVQGMAEAAARPQSAPDTEGTARMQPGSTGTESGTEAQPATAEAGPTPAQQQGGVVEAQSGTAQDSPTGRAVHAPESAETSGAPQAPESVTPHAVPDAVEAEVPVAQEPEQVQAEGDGIPEPHLLPAQGPQPAEPGLPVAEPLAAVPQTQPSDLTGAEPPAGVPWSQPSGPLEAEAAVRPEPSAVVQPDPQAPAARQEPVAQDAFAQDAFAQDASAEDAVAQGAAYPPATAPGVPAGPQDRPAEPAPAAAGADVTADPSAVPAHEPQPDPGPAPVVAGAEAAATYPEAAQADAATGRPGAPGWPDAAGSAEALPSGVPLGSHPDQPLGRFVPVEGQVPTTPHLAPTPPHPLVLPAQGPDGTQAPEALQGPQAADAPQNSQDAQVPDAPQDPQDAQVPDAPQDPQDAQVPDAPQDPQDTRVPDAPQDSEGPHVPEAVEPAQPLPAAAQAPQGPQAAQELPQVPQEQPEPVATVPAPREAEPDGVPAGPDAGHAPDVVQHAEDLRTRAADQEESTADVAEARQSTGPAAPGYADAEREAVLKVMRERRDIRNGFRGDPIPHDVLLRVLEAAHTAPSVGHSQPWDFVVIRSAETRRTMHELAMRQREAYAKSLPKGRAKQFKELKIEAILDTPVNIVVTADPTRGGRHTLGRHTQPQMAPYSSALAVENLWLAARAEGLGVGWVSFFDEREMVRELGLPEHLEVVAYLCVGYVDEFPDEPELMQAGWSKRRPLSWVVHEETYGRRALPGEDPHDLLAETVAQIRPLDAKALGEAWERQKRMTKPAGALGMLEIISAQLSGLSRQCPPPIPEPAAVAIFAGDHGVHAQGVTPWPQEVTAQMVANFLGGGAVCNAFATQVGAEVCVVDVGVAADLPATPGLLPRKIRGGTSDMTTGPAMTREEAKAAIEVGIETARDLVAAGNKALLTGEMGIANTTASAALISVFTGVDPAEVTGRGTGINDETLARKTDVVRRALEFHQPDPADPVGVLAAIGGFEHAAIVGLLLGGASLRTPVILDGVSAGAAALVARAIAPEVLAACIAGHRSAEPGHVAALNKLGLRPLVDLDLRLGEGTGALLALPLVQSTARAMHEVATFDSAGVTEK